MDDAKQRVINELNELSERTSKLVKFTLSEKFSELTSTMQYLMKDQVRCMLEYGDILRRRLDCWDKPDDNSGCVIGKIL
jgi:hypothetical protein